jgi:hypothetical protein
MSTSNDSNPIAVQLPQTWRVAFSYLDSPLVVELNELSDSSIAQVFAYGLNRAINDVTGGLDKTVADKRGAALKRYDAIVNGTWATGAGGGGTLDPVFREFRELVRAAWAKESRKTASDATWIKSESECDSAMREIVAAANPNADESEIDGRATAVVDRLRATAKSVLEVRRAVDVALTIDVNS